MPNKPYGYLLYVGPNNSVLDQNSRPLEIEDKANLARLINK